MSYLPELLQFKLLSAAFVLGLTVLSFTVDAVNDILLLELFRDKAAMHVDGNRRVPSVEECPPEGAEA